MTSDRDILAGLGLTESETVATLLAVSVWRQIHWDDGLWRGAGRALYQRFESRIRATSSEPELLSWVFRLATKCHVSPQLLDRKLIRQARMLDRDLQRDALRTVREQPGLLVSALRVLQDQRKAGRS